MDEKVRLGAAANGIKFGALALGLVCLLVALVFAFFIGDAEHAVGRRALFYHSYLIGFGFCLSIALAGLFFTVMQHMVKVGWSVNVRRVPEALAATLPFLGILAIPLLIPVLTHRGGELYPWAVPHQHVQEHVSSGPLPEQFVDAAGEAAKTAAADHRTAGDKADDQAHGAGNLHETGAGHGVGAHARYDYMEYDVLTVKKQPWLSGWFFTLRVVLYFVIWTAMAFYFYGRSKRQDETGDPAISRHLAVIAPVSIIVFALTTTFAAFDFLMSLDHHWYSTIFGVYFFAGGMIGMFAMTIVTLQLLQRAGFLRASVSTEHYHDLGKFLFAFIFFWGYIAFSQFMLQWYASIPEEVFWWARRGVTSAELNLNNIGYHSDFSGLSTVLLFGHFLIPFAYFVSRHTKRNREALLVGAVWMLVAHFIDIAWLVLPEYNNGEWASPLIVIVTALAVIGLFTFYFVQTLAGANLRPIRDPRAPESLAFVNM